MPGYGPNGFYTAASGLEQPVVFKVIRPELPVKRKALGLGLGKTPRRTWSFYPDHEPLRVKDA